MSDSMGRIFGACAALAGLWILVYWLWTPGEPRIRFDAQRAAGMAPPAQQGRPPAAPSSAALTEAPPPAVIPPAFRPYTVRGGDTLGSIAQRQLGSAQYAEAISRANPYVNFDQIRAGRTIRIPLDPANIQGRPVDDPVRASIQNDQKPPPRSPEVAESSGPVAGEADMEEYIVKPGDTLTLIARRHYGSIRYASLIFEANRDRLVSEDQLQLDQKLRLPPKPQ